MKLFFHSIILILLSFAHIANAGIFTRCDLSNIDTLTLKSFDHCSQSKLDAFYKKLYAGSIIPKGAFDGKVQLTPKGEGERFNLIEFIKDVFPDLTNEPQEWILERLWGGKIFYRQNPNKAVLFNRIVSSREMFPAHVYYGRSLFDPTRLSVIIDYSNNQNIEGYRPSIDWVVNEEGLEVRDEIRKVNDGLYLGRAYIKGKFLLNFVLGN